MFVETKALSTSVILTIGFTFFGCASSPTQGPEMQDSKVSAHDREEASGRTSVEPTEIAIADYHGQLHAVEVTVGDKKLPFLFDTGAGMTVVTPDVAAAVHCQPFGRLVGYRMSGERIDFPRCDDVVLKVSGVDIPHETVGVFDLMKLLPEGWEPLGGLIGLTTFADRPFTLDLSDGRVVLESPASFRERTSELEPMPIQLVKQASGFSTVVLLGAPVEAGMLWLELDSGSTAPLILAPHTAEVLGIDLDDPEQATFVEASESGPQRWTVESVTLDLGALGRVETSAVVRDIIYDANVGAPLMKKFVWTFDMQDARLWARPNVIQRAAGSKQAATGSEPPNANPTTTTLNSSTLRACLLSESSS